MSGQSRTLPAKQPVTEIDPAAVAISPVNARFGVAFDPKKSADLVADIDRRGQKIPAIVRRGESDSYILIVGTRRLGAIRHLREKNPDLMLNAHVIDVDDQEAWRIADAENSGRHDLTPRQRAYSYDYAIRNFFQGNQEKFANAIKKDPSAVSRTLKLMRIPEVVLSLLKDPETMSVNFGDQLMSALDDAEKGEKILAEAQRLAERKMKFSGPKLLQWLLHSPEERAASQAVEVALGSSPRQAVLKRDGKGGVTLRIKRVEETASPKDCKAWLKEIELELRKALGLSSTATQS
jgi:ParB family chromosome partitioning protein